MDQQDENLKNRLLELMEVVVDDWCNDPMSVMSFDPRVVAEAKALVKKRQNLRRCNADEFEKLD